MVDGTFEVGSGRWLAIVGVEYTLRCRRVEGRPLALAPGPNGLAQPYMLMGGDRWSSLLLLLALTVLLAVAWNALSLVLLETGLAIFET